MFDSDYKKLTIILNAERILYRGEVKNVNLKWSYLKNTIYLF